VKPTHYYPNRDLPDWEEILKKRSKYKRKAPMTVCIAAICEQTTIVGAVDRMMTSGDIEFEPDFHNLLVPALPPGLTETYTANPKIFAFTSSTAVMTAGDAGLQMEIMDEIGDTLGDSAKTSPKKWWTVKEVVDLYLQIYQKAKSRRAQAAIFDPFMLTHDTFIKRQHEMTKDFVEEILSRIFRFETNYRAEHGVEAMVVGVDRIRDLFIPHIYSIFKSLNGDYVTCGDSIGFSAIGIGLRHAESQFMLAGHSRHSPFPETLFLTYLAKKRAQVAPGVGKETDMFVIGPGSAQFAMLDRIEDFDFGKIDEIYQKANAGEQAAFKTAKDEMRVHIQEFFKKRAEQRQKAEDVAAGRLRVSVPGVTVFHQCSKCKHGFNIEDSHLSKDRKEVRCPKCGNLDPSNL
jgi:predicted Zn finger-like uncharacterized protein